MTLFLDACIIIYWIESAEPFYSKLIHHLRHLTERYPQSSIAISRLSLLECLVKPLREQNKKVLTLYEHFFNLPDLLIKEIDAQVIDIATQLRVHHSIKTPDAIQAACALSLEQKTIFVTNDRKFNQIPQLSVSIV